MESHKTRNIWVGIIVVVVAIWGLSQLGKNTGSTDTPEYAQCALSAQRAYELFKQNNSGENYPQIDGTSKNKKDATATTAFKFNYKSSTGLCFIEYIVTMQATTVDTNQPIQGKAKWVSALVADINKQQMLAGFSKTSYSTGSQKINGCNVQTPGSYDDLNNKPIKDLLQPTQCNSETEFDSLVTNRFGIK